MRERLRIEYFPSWRPCQLLLLLALLCCACLASLQLPLTPALLLCSLCLLLSVVYMQGIHRDAIAVLRFDGEYWFVKMAAASEEQQLTLRIAAIMPGLVRLQGRVNGEQRWRSWYFARDNCSEYQFRRLMRVVLGAC